MVAATTFLRVLCWLCTRRPDFARACVAACACCDTAAPRQQACSAARVACRWLSTGWRLTWLTARAPNGACTLSACVLAARHGPLCDLCVEKRLLHSLQKQILLCRTKAVPVLRATGVCGAHRWFARPPTRRSCA